MTALSDARSETKPSGSSAGGSAISPLGRLVRSGIGSAGLLLALHVVLLSMVSLDGNIGSDVGGKTATLDALVADGSLDLGYWAAEHDPDGSIHPMYSTGRFDDEWINVTTLPMLFLAWPLAEVGGLGLAMLIPMLGSVAAAAAARRLALDLGGNGALAFWATGLASPALFYGLSFWEHSIGLGCMAWATVFAFRAVEDSVGGRLAAHAAISGALFGLAATMRQEALVFGFVAGVVLVGARLVGWSEAPTAAGGSPRLAGAVVAGAPMALSALALLALNRLVEQAVLGTAFRDERTAGTAAAVGADPGQRIHDAVLTTFAPFGSVSFAHALIGAALVGAVAFTADLHRRGADASRPAVVAGLLYVLVGLELIVNGLSFVPALLIVSPVAVVGAVLGWADRRVRPLAAMATLALPLVWMVQYSTGMAAQWGGRYLLLSGWLLATIACGVVTSRTMRVVVGTILVGGVMSALSLVWTVERTNVTAESSRALSEIDDVVVFRSSLDARQTGSVAVQGRWLAADSSDELVEVLEVLEATATARFVHVDVAIDIELAGDTSQPEIDGFEPVGERRIDFLSDFDFRLVTYERTGR